MSTSPEVQQDVIKALPTFLQVVVVQPVEEKSYEGRSYTTQELECIALDAAGVPMQVGVFRVPKDRQGTLKPGLHRPVFGMRVDRKTRQIQPAIIDLVPDERPKAPK